MLSPETFEERMPVWTALSQLFLDTEQSEAEIAWIAGQLRQSPYNTAELEHILRDEVAPAFSPNLLSVAGEWAGWSEADIREIMTRSLRKSRGIGRFFRVRIIPEEWPRIKALLT